MKRHKIITAWNKDMAYTIGWELVKTMYDGEDNDFRYGTPYHYSDSSKKTSPGQLYWVKEGSKKGIAIATLYGMTQGKYSRAGDHYTLKYRVMLWLNEEGERLVKSAMTKALL